MEDREFTIKKTQISFDKNICEVAWNDGHISRFHAKWLRFNCRCSSCSSSAYFTYNIHILDFQKQLYLEAAEISEEGTQLQLHYENDINNDHMTIHTSDWLRSKCYCDACLDAKVKERDVISEFWRENRKVNHVPKLDYHEIEVDEDLGHFKWLDHVIKAGFCLIKEVPDDAVVKIAREVAYLDETNYGKVWELFFQAETQHKAYSNRKLPFHMDLTYLEPFPGVLFLHALKFDECVIGGETTLVDMFRMADVIREESPEDFKALTEIPVTYKRLDYSPENKFKAQHLEHQKPHITVDYFGKVVGFVWHLGCSDTLQVREEDVDRYYKAIHKMMEIMQREENQYKMRLHSGEMLILNNKRMVHSRSSFQMNGGSRNMKGAYMKIDELKSKYVLLARKLGIHVAPPKVGNCSSM